MGFYDKPLLKFERMLSTYIATFPRSFNSFRKAMPVWLHEKLWVPSTIRKELKPYKGPILYAEHHMSHAASAFLPSPYEEAGILTIDGVGEWATASYGVGKGTDITLFKEIRFPHSLGLLYSAFTYYLGFKVNSAEYKIMGLAPYGKPVHFERIMKEMVHLQDDGSFKLDMKYFAYDYGLRMTSGAFDDFFGGPPRQPETRMNEREFDIAASVQKVCEEVVLAMVRHLHQETGLTKLCMAGGVALNCVANGRVIRETPMKELWVQPAAGDAGGAVGVAHYLYNTLEKQPRDPGLEARLPRPRVLRRRDREVPRRGGGEVRDPRREGAPRAHRRVSSPSRTWWAGSRAGWSSAPGPSAAAASSPTPATPACATP